MYKDIKTRTAILSVLMFLAPLFAIPAGPAGAEFIEVTWLGDGSTEKTITIDPEGSDTSMSLSIKKASDITTFTMDIEGQPKSMGGTEEVDYDHNASSGLSGWDGQVNGIPPKSIGDCKGNQWNMKYWPITAIKDDSSMGGSTATLGSYACVHYQYTIDPVTPVKLRHEIYGSAYAENGDGMNVYMWNNNSGGYDLLKSTTTSKPAWANAYVNSSVGNYVNGTSNIVDVIITTAFSSKGLGYGGTQVLIDFAKLVVEVPRLSWPEDVYVDIGNDGDNEWESPTGTFAWLETISGNDPKAELQELIDDAGVGDDNVTIPIKVYTAKPGKLFISNISIGVDEYVNTPPELETVIGGDLDLDEDTDAPGLIDLALHFSDDLLAPAELTYEVIEQSDESKIKAVLAADGHTLDIETPTENWYGTQTFKVKATDDRSQSVESNMFTVTVNPVNDPPLLTPIGDGLATEGEPFEIEITATDADFEFQGDTLTFATSNPMTSIEKTGNGTAKLTMNPTDAMVGVIPMSVTVTDSSSVKDTNFFNITVKDVNHAPAFQYLGDQMASEDKEYKRQVKATDADSKDSIEFSDDTDLFDITPGTGWIIFTPGQEDVGLHAVRISASDGIARTDMVVNFTVKNTNDAPVIEQLVDVEVDRNDVWTGTVVAIDPDVGYDPAETLTFTISATPAFANMTIDPITGEIVVQTTTDDVGEHKMTVRVRDAVGTEGTMKFNMTVLLSNTPPTATIKVETASGEPGKAMAGETINLTAMAEDIDGDVLTFEWEWFDGIELDGKGEILSITLDEKGVHVINLTVSDGYETISVSTTIEVTGSGGGGGGSGDTGAPGFEAAATVMALTIALIGAAMTRKRE